MNPKQKCARIVGLLALVVVAIFPPWQLSFKTTAGKMESESAGYHPIWSPPETIQEENENRSETKYRINLIRLGIQCAVVLIASNVAVIALKNRD